MAGGLQDVLAKVPTGTGYVEAGAAVTARTGPQAWLEAGARPLDGLALFGRAYAQPGDVGAMLGARWQFDL